MRFGKILLLLIGISSAVSDYSGDQVLTLYPNTDGQIQYVRDLELTDTQLDFWSDVRKTGKGKAQVDLRVPRKRIEGFKNVLNHYGINYEVKISDVQVLIDGQFNVQPSENTYAMGYEYGRYHSAEEILDWTDAIASQYSNLVQKDILGVTFEGRPIPVLNIETSPNNPVLLLDCGFHAREWISPAFCQCFTRNLLEGYGKDMGITSLMDRLTFRIIPLVNVDGYKYSWGDDRMWRKTRSHYAGNRCNGTDPNRNCDALWSGPGSNNVSCTDTYHGPYVESEPEVKALANHIRANYGKIMAYVTVHSYSQLIIYPYSYTTSLAATNDVLDKYAAESAKAIEDVYGTKYEYGSGANLLYAAAGGSDDFAYDSGVPLSYTYELRDTGTYGFLLPEDQIEPTCVETTAGMMVFGNAALEMWLNDFY